MRLWLLILILLFAAILFSRGMATLPLWTDEGYSVLASQQPDMLTFVERDVHPPLFLYVLRFWEPVAGNSLFALRIPGLFISLIAVTLVYRFALDLFNLRTAVTAALIFASSDLVIGLAAVARHYNLYLLLAILTTYGYYRYTRQWNKSWGVLYIIAGAALLYTLYWGAFILLAQGIHFLIYHPRRLAWIVIPAGIMALLFLPWIPNMLTVAGGSGVDIHEGGHSTALSLNEEGFRILFFQFAGIPEALLIGLSLAGIAGSWHSQRYLPNYRTALIALWMLLPILVAILITGAGYEMLVHRPTVGLIPAMALLIGYVLSQLPNWQHGVVLSVLLITSLTTLGADYQTRQPWWEMAQLIEKYSSPGDAIAIEANIDSYAIDYHFQLANLPADTILRDNAIRNAWDMQPDTDVNAMIAAHEAVWLVEYIARYDLRFDLLAMGYVQTTPMIQLAASVPLSNEPIKLVRYARPPQGEPITTFGGAITLAEAQTFQHNDFLSVDLTWAVPAAPGVDYSISVILLNEAGLPAIQHDSYPLENASPTSTWMPGNFYFDRHNLAITDLLPGSYLLAVKVYTWWDGSILPPDNCMAPHCDYVVLEKMTLP